MPWTAAALCLLMLILSVGWAALSPIAAKQETLDERVKNYMQAQIDGKWDRAYSFLTLLVARGWNGRVTLTGPEICLTRDSG